MRKKGSAGGMFSMSAAFLGTVIGVGFSSGQELMQFFGDFGTRGIYGLLIASLGFFLYACLIMLLAQRLQTDDYRAILNPFRAKWLNPVIDAALCCCSLGVQVVMVAGSGVLLQAAFGIPPLLGSTLLLLLNGLACWGGGESIAKGFNISVPILVLGSILIAGYAIAKPPAPMYEAIRPVTNPLMGVWYTSAVLFVFHNMLSSIGVLAPIARRRGGSRVVVGGSLMGGAILGVLGLALVLCIVQNYPLVFDAPMPMLAVAHAVSPLAGAAYTILMLCAIFSTTIGITLGLGTRLHNTRWFRPKWHGGYIIVMSIACLLLSRLGFVGLVGKLYPVFGYISVAAFLLMGYHLLRLRRKLDTKK